MSGKDDKVKVMYTQLFLCCVIVIQKHLEENGYEVVGAEFTYIPNDLKDVTPEECESIDKMVERLEEFDDVQTVYTNMKPE